MGMKNILTLLAPYLAPHIKKTDRITAFVKNKISLAGMFALFNVVVIFGLGGALFFLRGNTDPYAPVPGSFFNGLVLFIFWSISLLAFILLVLSSKVRTGLKDAGAIFVLVALFELMGFGYLNQYIMSVAPRSHTVDDHQKITQKLVADREELPKKVNDYITLTRQIIKGDFIILYYDLKEIPGVGWDQNVMREELKNKTCPYFSDPTQYGTVNHFVHVFSTNKVFKFSFAIDRRDCSLGIESHLPPNAPSTPLDHK